MQASIPRSSNNFPIGSVVFALPEEQRSNREIRKSVVRTRSRTSVKRMEEARVNVAAEVEPTHSEFARTTRAWISGLNLLYWCFDVALLVLVCVFCRRDDTWNLYRPDTARLPPPGGALTVHLYRAPIYYWGLVSAVFVLGVICRGYVLLRPRQFRHYLGYASNPFRWFHYLTTMPIIATGVAVWSGVQSVWFCALVVALQTTLGLCMVLTDLLARPYGPDAWLFPRYFRRSPSWGSLLAALALVASYVTAVAVQDVTLPGSSVALLVIYLAAVLFAPLCQIVFTGLRPIHFLAEEIAQSAAFVVLELTFGIVATVSRGPIT